MYAKLNVWDGTERGFMEIALDCLHYPYVNEPYNLLIASYDS